MMSDPRADVALLVDFTDLRHSLCPEHRGVRPAAGPDEAGEMPEAAEAPPAMDREPDAAEVARSLLLFASRVGRVALARAYADWSRCGGLAQEVSRESLEPVLVPGTDDGEDRSHIRLVVDALEALFCGDEPDAFVLVTSDSTLLPLVQRLKSDGSHVVLVAPEHAVGSDLKNAADCFFSIEDVLDGVDPEPVCPRTWRGARAATPTATPAATVAGNGDVRAAAGTRTERSSHPTPVTSDGGFDAYDWRPFIQLIDELEHRLPFVGVRYLVNKVLGPHNCGIDDPRLKRDLINRAVEDQLIEMYPVGNVGHRADPVTACRLNRIAVSVVAVIGESSTPAGPPENLGEDGEGADDEGADDEGADQEGADDEGADQEGADQEGVAVERNDE